MKVTTSVILSSEMATDPHTDQTLQTTPLQNIGLHYQILVGTICLLHEF